MSKFVPNKKKVLATDSLSVLGRGRLPLRKCAAPDHGPWKSILSVCVGCGMILFTAGSAGAFDPDSLNDLQLWLDAGDSDSIGSDGGGALTWTDRSSSGSGAIFTSIDSNNNPDLVQSAELGGADAFSFTTTGQGLEADRRLNFLHDGTDFTLFVVYRITNDHGGFHPILHT